jgi:hypothetical protein
MNKYRRHLIRNLLINKPENKVYNDECEVTTWTPNLNKAYLIIQNGCRHPEQLAAALKETGKAIPAHLYPTPTLTLLKVTLRGDFNDQLTIESNKNQHTKTYQTLFEAIQKNPDLLPESLWEETEPSVPKDELQGEEYLYRHLGQKPLTAIVANHLTHQFRWDSTPEESQDAYTFCKKLKKFPSFRTEVISSLVLTDSLSDTYEMNKKPNHKEAIEKAAKLLAQRPTIQTYNEIKELRVTYLDQHALCYILTGEAGDKLLQTQINKALKEKQGKDLKRLSTLQQEL